MPILDLAGAARLEGYKPRRDKRTLGDPGTYTAALSGGSGAGGFAAAVVNRLTADFLASSRSADQDLYGDNVKLRARARKLALDNPFARKFLAMVKQNVVGEHGIQMKSKVLNLHGAETAETTRINARIEEEWKRWCRMGRCTADGRFSFAELQQMAIVNVAREGENLVKYVYSRDFNDTGFALQALDNDQLDDSMMQAGPDGSEIRMGVEVNKYRRPMGYHLFNGHPYDILPSGRERTRVPAEQILHTFVCERPAQTRGYTWMTAGILPLNHYGGFEESTLVASRAAAASFAVIEEQYAEGMFGGDDEDEDGADRNSDGTQMMTANTGEIPKLGPGQSMKLIDPKFPTSTYKEFSQAALRSVASGLLVSYPSLANDLEGVNFSSIRAGLIDERDMWRIIQRWFITHFCEPIRFAWLKFALLTTLSDITLSPAQMEQVAWMGRGWSWVDPQKDADSIILKLGEGLTTLEIECAAIGLDWQEVVLQRKREVDFCKANGVVFGVDLTGDQGGKGVAAGDEDVAVDQDGAGTK